MSADTRIVPVILSGGAGTRLWPLSRRSRPKQLHALTAPETMVQLTAARVADRARFTPPVLIAAERDAAEIEAQLAAAGADPALLLLEPVGRNTAAAIALAALEAEPSALLLVMPSDHAIGRPERFIAAVEAAIPCARAGHLVTFGIAPERPETGYGYIKRGAAIAPGVFAVERFVEKPDAQTARRYLDEGGHDWNGGIFLFEAGRLIEGLERHAPDILGQVRRSLGAARREGRRVIPDPELFAATRAQSIDHALMEHDGRVAVVPVEMDWSDIGSWDALYDIGAKDAEGNAISGDVVASGITGSLLRSTGPRVVALGVQDLIVVATPDAVLIVPRGESQRVKDVPGLLDTAGGPAPKE